MRKALIISSFFFAFFVYGLFLGQYQVHVTRDELEPPNPAEFYDYRGATHVHSDKNLGSGSYRDVIAAAQEANLDFLFFTDLNVFDRDLTLEGYHRKLLVMMGASYSYLDSRILAFDPKNRHRLESLGQAQVLLADFLSQSGRDAEQDLLVLAHPFKAGFSWIGPFPSGLDGIEIINLKSVWQRAWNTSKTSFIWSVLIYPFNSELALLRLYSDPTDELRLWDDLNGKRRTVGFAGNDATARTGPIGNFYFRFPSYSVALDLLSNHILLRSELTGEQVSDRRKIFDALSSGQFYISLDLLGNPKGFVSFIEEGEKLYAMGSRLRFNRGQRLKIRLPQIPRVPFEAVIIKNGERIFSTDQRETTYVINGPGVYRVIVRVIPTLPLPDGRRWFTWIYSNPFHVE